MSSAKNDCFMASMCSWADESMAIVLDNGSGIIKAGFAGEDTPRSMLRNIVGRPRRRDCTLPETTDKADCYIGDKALEQREMLTITHPVEHGIVTNWDDMEKVWEYVFSNELGVSPREYPILITEPSFNPMGNREKTVEILFEHFQFPAVYIANQARLTVYSVARCTSLILEMGDGVTHTMPIYEGHTVPHSIQRVDFGGRDLTDWMARLLSERGYSFATTAEREIVRDIKEKLSYVALDFEQELATAKYSKNVEQNYRLPDGQEIKIGSERFRCAEALYNPALIGLDEPGIAQIIHRTLMNVDVDMRKDFQYNIFLSGGTSNTAGILERMQKELPKLLACERMMRVYTVPDDRRCNAWVGGSILASLSTFQYMWMSRKDYDDIGPSIVHRGCIG